MRIESAGTEYAVVQIRVGKRTVRIATLLLLLLAAQLFFFAALRLYDPRVKLSVVVTAYATMLLLEAVQRVFDPGQRTRILTSMAACNSICLFFSANGEPWAIVPLATIAWLSRRFMVRGGRHLFNPGTFAILCGGLLSLYGVGLGGELVPISHGFNTIPHFSALVVALGTLLAWMGGHLGLVFGLVTGFSLTRGLPNAAELIIFFFAAPDPVTVPRSALGRAAFGLIAGGVTGLMWMAASSPGAGELGRQLIGLEVIKVGGLVMTGVAAALFGRSLQATAWARRLATSPLAAVSSSGLIRASAAFALLAYAAVVDRFYSFHANEIEIRIVDAKSGVRLEAPASEAFHRREIFVEFGADEIRAFWSPVVGSWMADYSRPGGARAAPGTDIAVHLAPACRPDLVLTGPPYIRRSRSLPLPKAGPAAVGHKYLIVVPVDVEAVMSLCGSAASGGRSGG